MSLKLVDPPNLNCSIFSLGADYSEDSRKMLGNPADGTLHLRDSAKKKL